MFDVSIQCMFQQSGHCPRSLKLQFRRCMVKSTNQIHALMRATSCLGKGAVSANSKTEAEHATPDRLYRRPSSAHASSRHQLIFAQRVRRGFCYKDITWETSQLIFLPTLISIRLASFSWPSHETHQSSFACSPRHCSPKCNAGDFLLFRLFQHLVLFQLPSAETTDHQT